MTMFRVTFKSAALKPCTQVEQAQMACSAALLSGPPTVMGSLQVPCLRYVASESCLARPKEVFAGRSVLLGFLSIGGR